MKRFLVAVMVLIFVMTFSAISLEKGHFNPSIKIAYKCSLIFKCPMEKIFCLEENYKNDI